MAEVTNPGFETPETLTGAAADSWAVAGVSTSFDWALYASLETLEAFEHSWLGNEGRIVVFDPGTDLEDANYDVAPEPVEDYEEEWGSNEDRLVAFTAPNLNDALYDVANDEFEDYEEEWDSNEDRILVFVPATHLDDALYDVVNDDVEDYEEEWNANEDRITVFVPATHLVSAQYAKLIGTDDFDGFEIELFVATPTAVETGTPLNIDPTQGFRIDVSGTFVATLDIQTRRQGSGTFVTQVTVTGTDAPTTLDLPAGSEAVRVDVTAYTSGTAVTKFLWASLD